MCDIFESVFLPVLTYHKICEVGSLFCKA